jgi:hypothetical protein
VKFVPSLGCLPRSLLVAAVVAGGGEPRAQADEALPHAVPGRGVTIADDDRLGLAVKTRVQLRYQLARTEAAGGAASWQDLASIGTARLYFTGHVLERSLAYVIQLAVADRDFRDGARSPIFDAFVDWRIDRDVTLRVGQFFVPFDRLRTVREFALQMAERPRPVTELTLDRDVGVALHAARLFADGSPLALRVGVFGGEGANASTARPAGALAVARLELRPLGPLDDDEEGDLARRAEPALALGVAAARNWNTARARSTTGATFAGGTVDFSHAAADVVAKWRGAAVQGEYLWRVASADAIASRAADGTARTEATRSAHGWIAQASYLFAPPVELVARASRMTAFAATDPLFVQELATRGQELGAGVNVYVNGHAFKVQLSWIARTSPSLELRGAEHVGYALVDATM